MAEKQVKHLIRIADTDILGGKNILYGLARIKGVNVQFANALCKLCKLEPTRKIGTLTEAEQKQILNVLKDPLKAGVPRWMINRRKDPETGADIHQTGTKLIIANEEDIKILKKIKCYRGTRHMFGLPSRGQRTKSNFRRNKGKSSLGVKTKSKSRGRV